ncbi:MAG: hypothetical protein OCC49_11335 [Fibrobacterales bacterium]
MKLILTILLILLFQINSTAQTWEKSFTAGSYDKNGAFMGGSQIMHLQGYKGKLYAANSYWEDSNRGSVGNDYSKGWAQILKKGGSEKRWKVDLDMGPGHLRPEILEELVFTLDKNGEPLDKPEELLVAASIDHIKGKYKTIFVYTRINGNGGRWEKVPVYSGWADHKEDFCVRTIKVYTDKKTGEERVFISIGEKGILSGVYDPTVKGKIRWDDELEFGPVKTRTLGMFVANGNLNFSSDTKIYKRKNGLNVDPSERYKVVHNFKDLKKTKGPTISPIGGIRGLTTVPNPHCPADGPKEKCLKESLILVWAPDNTSQGDIFRLDPNPDKKNAFDRTKETTLSALVNNYLGEDICRFVLAGYNKFLPIDKEGKKKYIVGMEVVISSTSYPFHYGANNVKFYRGALYAVRNEDGTQYRIKEVNGRIKKNDPPLVAIYDYEHSPFEGENAIYFSGLDPNFVDATNLAWIYKRTTLTEQKPTMAPYSEDKIQSLLAPAPAPAPLETEYEDEVAPIAELDSDPVSVSYNNGIFSLHSSMSNGAMVKIISLDGSIVFEGMVNSSKALQFSNGIHYVEVHSNESITKFVLPNIH